jgi:glycerate kinase
MTVIGTKKILVAPNSFKESLNSLEVAKHIRNGLKKSFKKFQITELPLADGGTGTSYVITRALKGKLLKLRVTGPLNKRVPVTYGIVREGISKKKTAIIELAEAAGLRLISRQNRNPLLTTTKGVGEMISAAINKGCKKIILGIGDSATIDCGVGALSVLGVKFLNVQNKEIQPNCQGLLSLEKIDTSKLEKRLQTIKITIASDVENMLTGKCGALVYARQKGASNKMLPIIDEALKNFKRVIFKQYGVDLDKFKASGAAGGIGGAMKVILNAEIKSGFEMVSRIVRLEQHIKRNDIVITGEGKIDKQSFYGKMTKRIVDMAYNNKKPVILIAGSTTQGAERFYKYGVKGIFSIRKSSFSLRYAINKAPHLLENLAYDVGKTLTNKNYFVK